MTYPLATRSKSHLAALTGIALFFIAGGIGHFALARLPLQVALLGWVVFAMQCIDLR